MALLTAIRDHRSNNYQSNSRQDTEIILKKRKNTENENRYSSIKIMRLKSYKIFYVDSIDNIMLIYFYAE